MSADLDLIRRAANQMRELAEPLIVMRDKCAEIDSDHYVYQIRRHGGGPLFRAHFSKWDPVTALAVADVLDHHLTRAETTGFVGHSHDRLVAVARGFLKEDA